VLEADVQVYEQMLARDADWALSEGSRHFEDRSAVQTAFRKITRRLNELKIPYAVVGGMALFRHGFRRFTEDVDLLVTADGLKLVHEQLEGLGYVAPFSGSKQLRDVETGVRVEFLVTGQFPGDGKPKPVAFPDPADRAVEIDGVRYISLPALIELKLASGMTAPARIKDFGDVQELIKVLRLPREFAEQLNEYVRPTFLQLWEGAQTETPEP
jgi:hypothetical protein